MHNTELGDYIKEIEGKETNRFLDVSKPTIVRIDGRAFHTFTKHSQKPYDVELIRCMVLTTQDLVREFHATTAYTQSDEITLYFENCEHLFSGKIHKIISILAGYTSAKFTEHRLQYLPNIKRTACFDARVFQVEKEDVEKIFMWRYLDAVVNSISLLSQAYFSQKELDKKTTKEMKQMLLQNKNVDWESEPDYFKWGTFVKREIVLRTLTEDELSNIPVAHRPTEPVLRTNIINLSIPLRERYTKFIYDKYYERVQTN